MSSNFKDSSERHLLDAEHLLQDPQDQRLANADHLFGISAECSLKAVMVGLGMETTDDGSPQDRAYKVHIDKLWAAFQSFAQGRMAARYLEPLDLGNPFATWSVDQRYWARSSFAKDDVLSHKAAADQCRTSLLRLTLDGVSR